MTRLRERDFAFATIVPPALLVAVAIAQIALAYGAGLSPWKGGGFGMFASTDGGLQRTVRIHVVGPERAEELRVPKEFATEAARAATMPSARRLARLGALVARRERLAGRPVAEVRIEVWRTSFAAAALEPAASLIGEARVTAPDADA